MSAEPLLSVENLNVTFGGREPKVRAAKDISFDIFEGETVAIVGESGSGKSVTALALTKLLPKPPICEVRGKVWYDRRDILSLKHEDLRKIRGRILSYVFQEPSTSLNPVFSVGFQIAEVVKLHLSHVTNVRDYVIEALGRVGIQDGRRCYYSYPHELSGGMQQRVMIAMALACDPKILVADEPTTALDVTIQKQIMDLLKDVQVQEKMSLLLITHNFGIVKDFARRVLVMFRGQIVEHGPTEEVICRPQHPYTRALIACIPRIGNRHKELATIDYSQLQ
jgi:peptide/nickel transport system ATP-binding protein/oligopeptide transport system ATP-binding protein